MRALVLTSIISLVGCVIDNDRVRVDGLAADQTGTFTYTAQSNTVMTENADGEAEKIRRDWLAETLAANQMCNAGYVVETRQLVEPDPPSGNAHNVIYTGRCL
jgi:hypothetical protein